MGFDTRLQYGVDVDPERIAGFCRWWARDATERALWPADAIEEFVLNLITEREHEPARVEQLELEKRAGLFAALAFN